MRDGIELIGKKIIIDKTEYKINNINLLLGTDKFYIELKAKGGYLNMSLTSLLPFILDQIK